MPRIQIFQNGIEFGIFGGGRFGHFCEGQQFLAIIRREATNIAVPRFLNAGESLGYLEHALCMAVLDAQEFLGPILMRFTGMRLAFWIVKAMDDFIVFKGPLVFLVGLAALQRDVHIRDVELLSHVRLLDYVRFADMIGEIAQAVKA